jgi:hypothetical protein
VRWCRKLIGGTWAAGMCGGRGSDPAGVGKMCVTGGVGWEGTGWGVTSMARRSLDRGGGGNGKVLL